jgi:hypothetical protein
MVILMGGDSNVPPGLVTEAFALLPVSRPDSEYVIERERRT